MTRESESVLLIEIERKQGRFHVIYVFSSGSPVASKSVLKLTFISTLDTEIISFHFPLHSLEFFFSSKFSLIIHQQFILFTPHCN